MWVLYRIEDGKIVDIQPTRNEMPTVGAEYIFIEGVERNRDLGGSVKNGKIELPVYVASPRDPRDVKIEVLEQRLAAVERRPS